MRFFIDTEFMEDGRTITPLSIAVVSDTGNALYLVINDVNRDLANDFVKQNVLPQIDETPKRWAEDVGGSLEVEWVARYDAGDRLLRWITRESPGGEEPEFWAWYGAYDWVLICQLFGNMTDLPDGWPMFVRDLRQLIETETFWVDKAELPKQNPNEHHALYDALDVREWFRVCEHAHAEWMDDNLDGG